MSTDGGASLLKHPSKAMEQLIKSAGRAGSFKRDQMEKSLKRPVMAFVMQKHDLESLQLAMRQALRKAACRVYALQVTVTAVITRLMLMCVTIVYSR